MERSDFVGITTFSEEGFDEYGYRLINSLGFIGINLMMYVDSLLDKYFGENSPNYQIQAISLEVIKHLEEFLERNKEHIPASFMEDACKFSYKSFAMCHFIKNFERVKYLIWLDADTYADKEMPLSFWESIAPREDEVVSYLGRLGTYPETGFLMFNLQHPDIRKFAEDFENVYNEDIIMELDGQTDCHAFQYAMKNYKGRNLTPHASQYDHCFLDVFGEYMDHTKGKRKIKGYSQERKK